MPSAEIIAIGTELLLGETADTNTRFLAKSLRALGIDVFRTQIIGDNTGRIAESIRQSIARADIVITTGGLGPTVDDPTRQAVADALDCELEFHAELWEQIANRIACYGRTTTENQKRQAFIPRQAIVLENPVGTAPAFIACSCHPGSRHASKKWVVSLPGVPREMETLFEKSVTPWLQQHFHLHEIMVVRTVHVAGLGEGIIDSRIGDLETLSNPTVGLTAHSGIVDVRITAKAESSEQAAQMISSIESDLHERLGENITGADGEILEEITLRGLTGKGWSLACYEVNMQNALLSRFERAGSSIYKGGGSSQDASVDLMEKTRLVMAEVGAEVGLGVAIIPVEGHQDVKVVILTPKEEHTRLLSHGGHPSNAPRWAANMAIDQLRRIL